MPSVARRALAEFIGTALLVRSHGPSAVPAAAPVVVLAGGEAQNQSAG
jgi:hypothetical protein